MDMSVAWLLSCGVAFIGTVIFHEIYMWLRYLMPKSVECWFCMQKTEVPYNLSNSWHCPKCEQYNGFTRDGDYNKEIDQLHDSKLNFSVTAYGRCKNAWRRGNSLCNKCNRNQQLKVEQLARFVPINERNYDAEIEHFRAQIEKAYALCDHCETLLYGILQREREEFCVPRRLNQSFIPKTPSQTWTLWLNVVVAVILSIIGFIQTRSASLLKKELRSLMLPSLKTNAPSVYSTLIKISPSAVKEAAIVLSDYILVLGSLLSLIAYLRSHKKPPSLLFNSLIWLGFSVLTIYYDSRVPIPWFSSCEVTLGFVTFFLTILILKDIYADVREQQLKQQTFLQPKVSKNMNFSPKHIPNGTSTPRGTPPDSTFSYVDTSTRSVKNGTVDREISNQWPGKYIGLEPGIKGLNLGTCGSRTRDDDVQSQWSSKTTVNPNNSCWSLYSTPNMTTRSAPVSQPIGFGSLLHVYSVNSACGQSRPTSPSQSIMSQTGTSFQTAAADSIRRRNITSNSIIFPPSLR